MVFIRERVKHELSQETTKPSPGKASETDDSKRKFKPEFLDLSSERCVQEIYLCSLRLMKMFIVPGVAHLLCRNVAKVDTQKELQGGRTDRDRIKSRLIVDGPKQSAEEWVPQLKRVLRNNQF